MISYRPNGSSKDVDGLANPRRNYDMCAQAANHITTIGEFLPMCLVCVLILWFSSLGLRSNSLHTKSISLLMLLCLHGCYHARYNS